MGEIVFDNLIDSRTKKPIVVESEFEDSTTEVDWYLTEDKKPDRWQVCVVATKDFVVHSLMTWDGEFFTVAFSDLRYSEVIKYWMPLPNKPQM